jgi:mannose-6-phosphate isomerase-like protein (cupin superfamily)
MHARTPLTTFTWILMAILCSPIMAVPQAASASPGISGSNPQYPRSLRQDAGYSEQLSPGVSIDVLASEMIFDIPFGEKFGFILDRIPLEPGARMIETLDSLEEGLEIMPAASYDTPQLLFFERGSLVVERDDLGEATYSRGDQLAIPAESYFDIRNDTGRCASLLRLSLSPVYGGGFSTNIDEPEFPELDCGFPEQLIASPGITPAAELPILMFVSVITFDPWEYDDVSSFGLGTHSHPGQVGLVVESGTIHFWDGNPEVSIELGPGSTVMINPGAPHAELYLGNEPAEVMMVGLLPPGAGFILWDV